MRKIVSKGLKYRFPSYINLTNVRGLSGKFVDTIIIFNRKRNAVSVNISGFAKIFNEQIDEFLAHLSRRLTGELIG